MKVLGIETSCDETAAAVVEDGHRIVTNVVNSQIDIHKVYGGVVPEVAARSHIEVINAVINEAVQDKWDEIDAIAVTYAPGLIGSLMVGTLAARTLAVLKNKPLYPIHHIEAHIYANFVDKEDTASSSNAPSDSSSKTRKDTSAPKNTSSKPSEYTKRPTQGDIPMPSKEGGDPVALAVPLDVSAKGNGLEEGFLGSADAFEFPVLALVVSGGHTQLMLLRNHGDFEIIGATRDDAVGEVFDKVAKILGLPYPGGPSIAQAALKGDRNKYKLPKAKLDTPYDFSFSGLKTAVLRAVQNAVDKPISFPSFELAPLLSEQMRNDFAASFEKTAVDTLVDKLWESYMFYRPKTVVIAGGVSANKYLREEISRRLPIEVEYPAVELCTDNAVMVAVAGYYHALREEPVDPYEVDVYPTMKLR